MSTRSTKRWLAACLIAGASIASQSAFASLARQAVLFNSDPFGVVPHGSFYYDDNLNVFYNPAYANDFKNWAEIEKTNFSGQTTNTAEGGFVAGLGSLSVGFYMNRGDAISVFPRANLGTFNTNNGGVYPLATAGNTMRPFDLLVAGDMGVKWGLGATYGSARRGDNNDTQDLTLRLGAEYMDLEPFVSYKIIGRERTADGDTFQNKSKTLTLGTRYRFGEWNPFIGWRWDKVNLSGGPNINSHVVGAGIGRNAKLGEASRLVYSLSYWRNTRANQNTVPIDLGVEGDVNSWLALRAGLQYLIWDRSANVSNTDSTAGRLGATVKVNHVNFDFAVGGGGATTTNLDTPAFSLAEGFFSVASLGYTW